MHHYHRQSNDVSKIEVKPIVIDYVKCLLQLKIIILMHV